VIRSLLGGVCRVRTLVSVKVEGAKVREPKGEVKNPLLKTQRPAKFIALATNALEKPSLPSTFVTEFDTKKGGVYVLKPQ
jgi:hypothetical protein